jgi:D-proline reductase (dithiol) PrdB
MFSRLKNRWIAKVITRFPGLAKKFIDAYRPWESKGDIPWTPVSKPLADCKIALVTTSGVHHLEQEPFDMGDPDGDPSWRELDIPELVENYRITHDYYDHSDAEKDLNIIFPADRLQEFANEGVIGDLARKGFAFMGQLMAGIFLNLLKRAQSRLLHVLKLIMLTLHC